MMAGDRGAWDETDDGRLWTLLAEGLSAAEIGARMGKSKNAILSRVHRRGWRMARDPIGGPLRRTKSGKYASPSPKSPPPSVPRISGETAAPEAPALPDLPEPLPPAAVSSLVACVPALPAAFSHCQYPKGDRPNWDFCQEPVAVLGAPYCATHMRICWQVLPRRHAA